MKRLASLFLALVLLASLCACGNSDTSTKQNPSDNVNSDTSSKQNPSDKGTISNPYSINDTIEFVGYQVESVDYLTRKRTVYAPSTFKLTNMKVWNDDERAALESTCEYTYEYNGKTWLLTFEIEIVDSDINEAIRPNKYLSINNINSNGIQSAAHGPTAFRPEYTDFGDLQLLPHFNANVSDVLINENAGELTFVVINYCTDNGEYANIYIDPYK